MLIGLAAIGLPFIPGWAQLRPFVGDLILIGATVAVLLAPFFAVRRTNLTCAIVALAGVALAFAAQLAVVLAGGDDGLHFRGILVADPFGGMWKLLLLLFVAGVILMWFTTSAQAMHEGDGPEYFTLLLAATLGMSLMASTTNLLMLFLAVEMASLPSYVLAGFRKTHRIGAEASLKYVLFGAATAAVMVFGLTYLYGLYGSLQLEEIAARIGQTTAAAGIGGQALLAVAMAGLLVGIGFKISAVPLHFWCPDVFEGATIDVTTFLSVASKGAALVLLLRVVTTLAQGLGFQGNAGVSLTTLAAVIGVMGAVTATVGNLGALVQNNIKRLLAYSSIAHAGYMLCAVSLLVRNKAVLVDNGGLSAPAQAILLYLAVYLFMNLGAFTVAGLIWRQTGSEDVNDYAALWRRSPVAAACMTAFMFSLIGLPPFAGFAAKFNLMWALGSNGGWWWWLVAVIGANTIFSLYYYVRIVKIMYLSPSDAAAVPVNPLGLGLAVACAAALLLMFVGYGPLGRVTTDYGRLYLTTAAAATTTPASAAPAAPSGSPTTAPAPGGGGGGGAAPTTQTAMAPGQR
ncbi:MAG TPA: NADH-quinone oxidoreductase subunit N [Tepidisphaeraceae bacterium]|nr:NADH-quinone oxidoreductase subunit N [Tepidisphaeraceae bacterium]